MIICFLSRGLPPKDKPNFRVTLKLLVFAEEPQVTIIEKLSKSKINV